MNELETCFEATEAARRIGYDLHCFSRLLPQPDWPAPVREGFDAAAARSGSRAKGDRFRRKWLQLRLNAWQRGRAVAADVTAELLVELDVAECPVTRQPLTHGKQVDTDWSIDRLNNNGAYAASNLCVMSRRANRAKGALDFDQVLGCSRLPHERAGLQPIEWLRLAVLMEGPAFAMQQHLAPMLPLCAPLPTRSVRLALQQIQRLLTVRTERQSGKNALVRALMQAHDDERSQLRLRTLGDVVHEAHKGLQPGQACWDLWLQPEVMTALRRWRESLSDPAWARVCAISGCLAGGRRVTPASLKVWQLPTRGYAVARHEVVC